VEPLSDDPAKVTAALDRAARETGAGAMANIDASVLSRVIDRGVDMTSPFGQADAQAQLTSAKTAAQGAYDRGKSYLASLTNFVGALGGVPGRKVMFWVSDGFVLRPGERLIQQWEAAYAGTNDEPGRNSAMDVNRFDLSTDMTTLMHRAKASEVHIVTIPPAGIVTSNVTAEQAVMEANRMIGAATMEQLGQQQTMQNLAASTGGELLVGGNVSGRAANALTALDTAYSIGFLDPHPGDGKVHTLKISVSRPDLKVRHAESYLDQTFEGKAAEANLSAIYMDSADNPLEIELSVRSMTAAKGHDFSVVLLTMIPLGNVILSPAGEVHEGKLALWLAARDVTGRVIQSGRQALPLRVPNASIASAQGQTAGFTFTMNLPAGSTRAAVTVVDQTGHARSTVPLTFVVGPSAPEGTAR
jgi:VWFA-related protein